MPKPRQHYETAKITVTFDPDVCIHSGVCLRGLPEVFEIKRKRWIRPERAVSSDVAAQIDRCPSGALQYEIKKPSNRSGEISKS
ncbi:MAG: (4Fe-4S)-binding protein [Ignavibacteriales bacterium]|nr:(4Fe-4S)-binding protein [Ignavibacteriales bacterium]